VEILFTSIKTSIKTDIKINMKRIFLVTAVLLIGIVYGQSQNITGQWNGVLDVAGTKLRIVFHIEKHERTYSCTMDSPDQGAKGIPVTTTRVKGKTLLIEAANLAMRYEGKRCKDGIKGTFSQMGMQIPLTLTRNVIVLNRPQNPQPPYPYHEEEVLFVNQEAGITLAGTYTYPKTEGKFPAVVLVSGSGAQNRNEELFDHCPFLVLADYLTRQGIAVLRYDDRGVGQSQGIYHTATLQDFATDAFAALQYLRYREETDKQKVGLIGHSEGGSIAFLLAGKHQIDFIVSMAGPAVKGDELMKQQRQALFTAMGMPDESIRQNEELLLKINAMIDAYSADSILSKPNKYAELLLMENGEKDVSLRNRYKSALLQVASPEMQSLLNYDPADDLRKISCPVLALQGEKDLQVPADINLQAIQTRLKDALTIKKYPELNHLFQHATTGLTSEYAEIEETISPEVLENIVTWILSIGN
jgi:pimeloyl-ACP methyl ester carboxylesterase